MPDQMTAVNVQDVTNLMKDNIVLGNKDRPKDPVEDGEPLFELWENGKVVGTVELPVTYLDKSSTKKKSKVNITFSISKHEYQKATGHVRLESIVAVMLAFQL